MGSPAASAAARSAMTRAAAPSEICEAFPAVTVPVEPKAGRNPASESAEVSARMPSSSVTLSGSPLRCGTATGTISSANTPDVVAAAARRWLSAAHSSWTCRSMPRAALRRSDDSPMMQSSKAHHSPSWVITSTIVASPMRSPWRAPGRT